MNDNSQQVKARDSEEERKKSLETHYESVVNEMTKYHEGSTKNLVENDS